MYAAVRAQPGDQVANPLTRSDRYEVFMTPEQVKAAGMNIKPGLFALWNLHRGHLEWRSLNEKGWLIF